MTIFFNAESLPESDGQYVCWLDVMGTQSIMSRSLSISANFICRLHIAALESLNESLRIYPLLDGMYVTSERQQPLLNFLRGVFLRVSSDFIEQREHFHRFIIKASVAFGPILHGVDIPDEANWVLRDNVAHRNALLLGIPIIQAYQSERRAPPFGVYIHESVRTFSPSGERPLPHIWWRWFRQNEEVRSRLYSVVNDYYGWCEKNRYELNYEFERLQEHRRMAKEYFAVEEDNSQSGAA